MDVEEWRRGWMMVVHAGEEEEEGICDEGKRGRRVIAKWGTGARREEEQGEEEQEQEQEEER